MKWEYQVFSFRETQETILNTLGQDGWELVSILLDKNNWTVCIFKRQK